MEGTLTVPSDEDFDAVEIRCEIQCMEEARRAKDVYDAATNRNIPKEVQESATLYSARVAGSGSMHISKGFSQALPMVMNIPAGGLSIPS